MIHLLVSINPALNRKRFYEVGVQDTLLGDACVTRRYGRLGGAEHTLAPIECRTKRAAVALAEKIVRKKLRRGYVER